MSDPRNKPRRPEELADLLATKKPLLLVGGQAVNLWALHYFERAADLAPFVSRDIDILGNRETLEEVAALVKGKPEFFPMRPPTNVLGVVVAHDNEGDPVLIEVLRYAHGVDEEELREPTYSFVIGKNKIPVLVPGPVALFKAKVANLADLSQEGRQDAKHVQILAKILPDYWSDMVGAVKSGKVEERKLIRHLEMVLSVATSAKGKSTLPRLSIETKSLFEGVKTEGLSKVQAFISKRLIRFTQDPLNR